MLLADFIHIFWGEKPSELNSFNLKATQANFWEQSKYFQSNYRKREPLWPHSIQPVTLMLFLTFSNFKCCQFIFVFGGASESISSKLLTFPFYLWCGEEILHANVFNASRQAKTPRPHQTCWCLQNYLPTLGVGTKMKHWCLSACKSKRKFSKPSNQKWESELWSLFEALP